MSEQALHGLACPRCGGTVPIPEGQVIVLCPFCEQRSLVSGERGVLRYQIPLRIDRARAQAAMQGFLTSSSQIANGLLKDARVSEVFLVHLPFWSAWGRGVAWTFGQEKVGSGDNVRYDPREKHAVKDLQWNGVACDVGEFGVRRISLDGRPLEPFNGESLHQSGMVFEPVGSDEDALAQAEQAFQDTVRLATGMARTAQLFTRLLSPQLGLVYYPVWVVRYLYHGRSFQVVVDGFDGAVLYGKAPGNLFFRAVSLVGGMALGAFLAIDVPAAIIALSSSSDDDLFGFVLAAFGAGLALMYAGYRRFRYGEHFEFHRYKEKSKGDAGLTFGSGELKELAGEIGKIIR
jgi:hypothetical protein